MNKGPGSTKRHVPSEQQKVQCLAWAAVGVPHHQIAILLGINLRTLLKCYDTELKLGEAQTNAENGKRMFAIITNPKHPQHATMLIYWSKCKMGFREVQRVEVGNIPGQQFRTKAGGKISKARAQQTYEQMCSQ